MELSHQGGAEGESLLRGERAGEIMPHRSQVYDGDGEKAPFLRNEPVKLTPAWEASNLPNDTLNLKGITMDAPKDKHNLIYMTMVLHGLGTLIAWNIMITAKDYFEKYKLKGTSYAETFMVDIAYASQLPNVLFAWFNVFVPLGGDLTIRIVVSLLMEVVIFVIIIVLAMLDTTSWVTTFFWLTMVTAFLLSAFNAVFQNSVFGVAARLPSAYTGAVILGTNICGTMTVLLNWATSTIGDLRTATIYYFIGGMFVILVCFDTYFALPLNRFYRYHDALQKQSASRAESNPVHKETTRHPLLSVFKQCWVQLLNVWLVFFASLACFPAITSEIKSTSDPALMGNNFVLITCFLTFNFTAMVGNITANNFQCISRRWLIACTLPRLLFIPIFWSCNYQPQGVVRNMPVLIHSDWMYWGLSAALGWSSGHLSSVAMMYVSSNVEPELQAKAGMVGGAMLTTGILSGVAASGLGRTVVAADIWNFLK